MLVRLKIALLRRGISQIQLARAIGRTPAHVSRLIRGHVRPRARDRRRIASFLSVSETQLFPCRKRRSRMVSGPALAEAELPRRGGWHPHDGDATSRGAGRAVPGPCSERGKEVPRVRDSRPARGARSESRKLLEGQRCVQKRPET